MASFTTRLVLALLALMVGGVSSSVGLGEPRPAAAAVSINAYVISSGDPVTDNAIVGVLTGAGHTATLGVQPGAFDGTQSLAGYDVVLLQNSYNWASQILPLAGQTALTNFVNAGGGLVTGEWTLWRAGGAGGGLPNLYPALPGSYVSYRSVGTVTYTQATSDPVMNNGVISPLTFNAPNFAGSETQIFPKPGATAFYTSDFAPGAAGVLGWSYGAGRTVSFSTFFNASELSNPYYRQIVLNTLLWVSQERIGGRNMTITNGAVDLTWDDGAVQDSYTLLKYNTSTAAAELLPISRTASSYDNATAVNGVMYCYLLAAFGPINLLGLGDLECSLPGSAAGTVLPQGFSLKLSGTTNATMQWTAPAGGADSYLLQRIPLDGSAITNVPLLGTATTSTQAVVAAGTCFQLIAYKGAAFGSTDVLCGVPGLSTLSQQRGGNLTAQDVLTEVTGRLAGLQEFATAGALGLR